MFKTKFSLIKGPFKIVFTVSGSICGLKICKRTTKVEEHV
jgi:hypothetical protein